MKSKPRLVFDLAVIVFFAVFVYEATEWRLQARLYPWAIGIPMLLLSIVHFVREATGGDGTPSTRQPAAPVDFQFTQSVDSAAARRRAISIFSWIFAFFAGIWLFGFILAVPALVFLYLKLQAREGWWLSVTLTGAAWLLFWGLFDRLLRLPFPDGAIFSVLGPG